MPKPLPFDLVMLLLSDEKVRGVFTRYVKARTVHRALEVQLRLANNGLLPTTRECRDRMEIAAGERAAAVREYNSYRGLGEISYAWPEIYDHSVLAFLDEESKL